MVLLYTVTTLITNPVYTANAVHEGNDGPEYEDKPNK